MTAVIGWDVWDDVEDEWVDLFATFARSHGLGGDPLRSPTWRGEDDEIPGRRGKVAVTSTIDAGSAVIAMILRGAQANGSVAPDQEAAFLDNWRDLRRLVYKPAGFLGRRRLRYPEGVASHVGTMKIEPGSLTPGLVRPFHGKCLLEVAFLDGTLYDESTTTVHAGTSTVGGDVETEHIALELPSAGTLTNTTLGISVTVTVASTLYVYNFTANTGIDTISQSDLDRWFALAPGSNVITWSGTGTPNIIYRAAHL